MEKQVCLCRSERVYFIQVVQTPAQPVARPPADVHCCVILAASALISEMSSRLMRNTKRSPAICRHRGSVRAAFSLCLRFIVSDVRVRLSCVCVCGGGPCTHLHHRVVVQFPLVAWQNGSAVDVDGSSALVGDEEVSVILQFDNPCEHQRFFYNLNTRFWLLAQLGDLLLTPTVSLPMHSC